MKKLLTGLCLAVLILVCAGAAQAQDENNFKGFYVGGNAGYVHGMSQTSTTVDDSPLGYFAASSLPAIQQAGHREMEAPGFNLGVETGYNFRVGNHWLLGVEGEFGAFQFGETIANGAPYPCCAGTTFAIGQKMSTDWMATIRPRLGYVHNKWLMYVTYGLAVTHAQYRERFTDTFAGARESASFSSELAGWAAGGGLERKAGDHWGLKGEYLYANFGDEGVVSVNLEAPAGTTWPNVFHHNADMRAHIARVGLNYYFSGKPPVPPSAACSASPAEVMEGEPVAITATPSNFKPDHTLTYDWKSSGGKVSGTDATAKIDTTGMAAGNYTASATVTDSKNKKMVANCSANFAVKEKPKNPPQLSCSANPQTVQSGSPSTISCTCTSPDGAQLQPLAWQTSMGKIAGEGMTATLDTAGLESGAVNVTTTCTDARGLSSSANTNVNVEKPVVINPSKINECAFPNKVKPARVDNTCKAALDDVALRLQREADAKAVIVGEADAKEKPKDVAAQRAINTKGYLVNEKQIDATRLETRTGSDGGRRVEIWLVPAGSTAFDQPGTTVVNAPTPKAEKKKAAGKKAAKKPAK